MIFGENAALSSFPKIFSHYVFIIAKQTPSAQPKASVAFHKNKGSVLFRLFFSRQKLHEEQAAHHHGRAHITPWQQHLVGQKIGHDGGKQRLQSEDQAHMAGSGVLLLDGLHHKGKAGAEQGQKQCASPDERAGGQPGLFQNRL